MSIEMSSDSAICFRCGKKFGKRKGYFPVVFIQKVEEEPSEDESLTGFLSQFKITDVGV